MRLIQRVPGDAQPAQSTEHTGALCGVGVTRTCAVSSACDVPDASNPPDPAGGWQLTIAIDIETEDASDVVAKTVGHTYVEFRGADGKTWTFGFYPNPTDIPNEMKYEVFGCMVHPDTIHTKCVDYRERFIVTAAQYQQALEFAQLLCRATPKYHIMNFNCTTFAVRVAEKAGQTVPTYRGKVSKLGLTADNPNTLLESLRDRDVPTRKLTGDSEIRDWLRAHSYADIGKLPEDEKLRLVNRLLDGWVSDDDLTAVHWVCGGVTTNAEMERIDAAITPRVKSLNARQGAWLRRILDYRPNPPSP